MVAFGGSGGCIRLVYWLHKGCTAQTATEWLHFSASRRFVLLSVNSGLVSLSLPLPGRTPTRSEMRHETLMELVEPFFLHLHTPEISYRLPHVRTKPGLLSP